jgi:ankyrin repeat protein
MPYRRYCRLPAFFSIISYLFLVDTGIPINSQNKKGDTVLHILALNKGTANVIKDLLELGADPGILNGEARSPFFLTRLNSDNFRALLQWGTTSLPPFSGGWGGAGRGVNSNA